MSAAALAVESLSLRLGTFRLRDLGFTLDRGEILVILGPNGAGKSVTLETIAGFHRPAAGRILIAGRDVTALPPERRQVGLLFQNFGLFPHLTVAQNVGFGLRARRGWRRETGAVAALMAQFGIAHLSERRPEALSPGEKQRTALARALATQPDLFLLDEPFSALDTGARERLRDHLLEFLRATRTAAIFVTHDHADAAALADRILVLRQGEIVQSGGAAEIFRRPADPFIAEFVGIENILAGRVLADGGGKLAVAIGDAVLVAAGDRGLARGATDVRLCIRAEEVRLGAAAAARAMAARPVNRFEARITALRPLGPLCKVQLDCGFALAAYVLAREVAELGLAPGNRIEAQIDPRAIHVIPAPATARDSDERETAAPPAAERRNARAGAI